MGDEVQKALLHMVPGGKFIGAGLGLLGGLINSREVQQTRDDIKGMAQFNPQTFGGFGGSGGFGEGFNTFQFDPQMQELRTMLGGQGAGLLGGGLFNDPSLQAALGGNDILGALQQANTAFGQQAGGSAFGGLGGVFDQSSGMSNLLAQQTLAGPQDFTGGMQSNLFSQGMGNLAAAGNQDALRQQALGTMREGATQGGLLDMAINKFQDRGFATGRSSTTAGINDQTSFLDSIARQDLGFQRDAFGLAQQQQGILSGIGGQQLGTGANLFGQNLGAFQGLNNLGLQFGNQAIGAEAQGFGQLLQALQQNQSAGMNRLSAAQGLFGLGTDTFNQQFGLGLGAQAGVLDQSRFGLDTILGLRNAEANRIGATSGAAQALAETQSKEGGGGLFGSLVSGIGSLFGG